ncbi:MAG: hypothetical protein RIR18_2010 [Pseudomonadota bacterium]|jgi:diguanylate cyclase (GGDEF)-like protein/PAS domain S-box-containing protein
MFSIKSFLQNRRRQAEALAWQSQAIDAIGDGVVVTNQNGLIEYVNPAFTQITGYSAQEAIGKTSAVLKSGLQLPTLYSQMWSTILSGATWRGELVNRRKDGSLFNDLLTVSPVLGKNGAIQRFIAVHHDISQRKMLEEELSQLAHFDHLTCLPNRALFLDRLGRAMSESRRDQHRFAVFFVDLDGFKSINDAFGHRVGDGVLEEIAKRLMSCIRESDTVARFGGDEFACLLKSVSRQEAITVVAEKIVKIVAKPIEVDKLECCVGASIGVAIYPDDGVDAESLMHSADLAMYEAKRLGKGRWVSASDLF